MTMFARIMDKAGLKKSRGIFHIGKDLYIAFGYVQGVTAQHWKNTGSFNQPISQRQIWSTFHG